MNKCAACGKELSEHNTYSYQGMAVCFKCARGEYRKINMEIGGDGRADTFNAACKPLILWLREHMHPHATVIVDSECAELVEGVMIAREG